MNEQIVRQGAGGGPRSTDRSESFEALLAPVVRPAFSTALRLTMNRQDAEDLVQEASLLAYRAFDSFQRGTNFKAWFFRIMLNSFYSSRRKRRPEQSLQDLEDEVQDLYLYARSAEAGLPVQDTDPARLTVGRLTGEAIADALAALPEEFRVVCTLYFMEDFSYQEIAEMLAIPVGTVRSRLHRGRKILQRRLWELAVDQGIVPGEARTAGRDDA